MKSQISLILIALSVMGFTQNATSQDSRSLSDSVNRMTSTPKKQINSDNSGLSPAERQTQLLEKQQQAKLDEEARLRKEKERYARVRTIAYRAFSQLKYSGIKFDKLSGKISYTTKVYDGDEFGIGDANISRHGVSYSVSYFCPRGISCIVIGAREFQGPDECTFQMTTTVMTVRDPDRSRDEVIDIESWPCESFTDESIDIAVKSIVNNIQKEF